MKKILLTLVLFPNLLFSQISINPNPFEVNQSVTITVDINSNDTNCNSINNPGSVYMHAGIGDESNPWGYSVVGNWGQEFVKWLSTARCNPLVINKAGKEAENLINDFTYGSSKVRPVLIVSYEMACKYISTIRKAKVGLVICDEAHRLKNSKGNKTILKPVGSGIFSSSCFFCSACLPSQTCFGTISFGLVIF